MREPVDIRSNRPNEDQRRTDDGDSPISTADVARTGGGDTRSIETAQPKQEHSEPTPLFRPDEASGFHSRWQTVQGEFVDDPRHAVEDADHLVAEAIQRLAKVFADERTQLEQQWNKGGDVSTENLRLALQKYRSFFERLLAA